MEETKNNIVIDDSENRETQKKIVLGHLLEFGCLSMPEGLHMYSISRLADVIYRLKHDGHNIEKEWVNSTHPKTGHPCRYANYIYKGVVAA